MPLAGQNVQTSGVYAALHTIHQNEDGRELIFCRGDSFPGCSECGFGVHYALVQAAPGAKELPEFASAKKRVEHSSAA